MKPIENKLMEYFIIWALEYNHDLIILKHFKI